MRGTSDTNSGPVCRPAIPTPAGPNRLERRVPTTLEMDRTVGAGHWHFAGGYFDASTGLYKFGMRYYDPSVGRWTQEDSQAGPNLYTYAGGNPVNNVDPTGRNFWSCSLAQATLVLSVVAFIGAMFTLAALPATAGLSAFVTIAGAGAAVVGFYSSLYALTYGGACNDPYSF